MSPKQKSLAAFILAGVTIAATAILVVLHHLTGAQFVQAVGLALGALGLWHVDPRGRAPEAAPAPAPASRPASSGPPASLLPVLLVVVSLLTGCKGELAWGPWWGDGPRGQAVPLKATQIQLAPQASAPTCPTGQHCIAGLSGTGVQVNNGSGWDTAVTLTGAQSLSNKTLVSPTITGASLGSESTLTAPVIAGGLTASGSASNNFGGSTGPFVTSSGANTLSGDVTIAAGKDLSGAAGDGAVSLGSMTGDVTLPTGAFSWAGASAKAFSIVADNSSSLRTTSGTLTIDAPSTSTWKITGGSLNLDASATLYLGPTLATVVRIGRPGQTVIFDGVLGAALDANANVITGLAAGSAAGHSLRYEQGGLPIYGGSGLAADAIGAATRYLSGPGVATVSATAVALGIATRAGVLRNLRCQLHTAPGGSDTVVFTVFKSTTGAAFSATTETCTITGSSKLCNDSSNTPATTAGDIYAIQAVSSAGTAAGPFCGVEIL